MAGNRPEFDTVSTFAQWQEKIASGPPIKVSDLFKLGVDIVRMEAVRLERSELGEVVLTTPENHNLSIGFQPRQVEQDADSVDFYYTFHHEEELYEIYRHGLKGHERFEVLWGHPECYSLLTEGDVTEWGDNLSPIQFDQPKYDQQRITFAHNVWRAYIHTLQRGQTQPSS